MHTLTTFYAGWPEFSNGSSAQNALVQQKLNEAARAIDPDVWGEHEDDGHGYLTAHLLALSPMGNTAKLTDGKSTTYWGHYQRLLRIVVAGIRST